MDFEWDEAKNRLNIAKHGIGFARASTIFAGPTLDAVDDRADYGEVRTKSLGMLDGILLLAVIHTERDGVIRLISARRGNRIERRRYEEALRQGTNN
ncbi:MAG: BrnT family toxin [Rhodospirillaceae bacterium]|nr:BrnT family toxin [Rhodospirillaceae bacterium]